MHYISKLLTSFKRPEVTNDYQTTNRVFHTLITEVGFEVTQKKTYEVRKENNLFHIIVKTG